MADRLSGQDRTLDALVGLIIVIATLLIGLVSLDAIYAFGVATADANPFVIDVIEFGWMVALYGGGAAFAITTLVFLARLASAKRSWTAALTGTVLMTVAFLVGFAIMVAGS